ncbi:MAG: hypothetical protein FJ246_00685 [Nitrospira sp.]|nr:hypothetical protein [Nitrospira sp.]
MTGTLKLPVEALAPNVRIERLGFKDTSELAPLEEPLGQERAVEALEFGLRMPSPGFNIYVSGPIGSGKWSLAKDMVKRLAKSAPSTSARCGKSTEPWHGSLARSGWAARRTRRRTNCTGRLSSPRPANSCRRRSARWRKAARSPAPAST